MTWDISFIGGGDSHSPVAFKESLCPDEAESSCTLEKQQVFRGNLLGNVVTLTKAEF